MSSAAELLDQLVLLAPANVEDWLRERAPSSAESNWLGLAEVAGQEAMRIEEKTALDWARVSIAVRELIAKTTDDKSYRQNQVRNAMTLRVAMINRFGPAIDDPVRDSASIYRWFLDRHSGQLDRANSDSSRWQSLSIERIRELRQIKNELIVLRDLQHSSEAEAAEVHGWMEIWPRLP
ncbi:hypothetical protein NN3_51300 [Nocardia neocaledoniensis NBRC 108232]|uniref:Uncharacterized protein n=1 Tax=Nocardia neocaledoniensis TaxID=236511 RepID=A0A317NC74_9NOCA|nr:hypothetical protein [Nocardia neocaledoniensis]PWV72705.1 hypothetical protein DFR69_10813 [Nocardia neocaledoniensis]GEM34123.1 hypothetical protein NN3_51300 [Nocardia neocaledoniensis NBRC 108232]